MSTADKITPNETMTFTVQRAPRTTAGRCVANSCTSCRRSMSTVLPCSHACSRSDG